MIIIKTLNLIRYNDGDEDGIVKNFQHITMMVVAMVARCLGKNSIGTKG